MIPEDIKLEVNVEQSRAIQELCFTKGIYWRAGETCVLNLDRGFLFIARWKNIDCLSYGSNHFHFRNRVAKLVTFEDAIKILRGIN